MCSSHLELVSLAANKSRRIHTNVLVVVGMIAIDMNGLDRRVSVAPMMDYTDKGGSADESTASVRRERRVPVLSQLEGVCRRLGELQKSI